MEYIEIGKIVNTHGLKGELKIESWSSFDEIRYAKGNTVFLKITNMSLLLLLHIETIKDFLLFLLKVFKILI